MGNKGGLFRCADGIDKVLMIFGILGSIGDGLMNPLIMLVLTGTFNNYGSKGVNLSNEMVDKLSLRLLYVAIAVGVSAFIEGVCWTRTAERQTSCMRTEYLKSILRQEVGFFNGQDASTSTFEVISTISSDADIVQDTIAEKIPNCLSNLTAFTASILISFSLSWRFALATLPISLLLFLPVIGIGKLMINQEVKIRDAYGVAGGIAEQAISSIRTVYSYTGEHQTLHRFSKALQKNMELAIKQGFTKGLLMGSMGMLYVAWAFGAWVGSILVTERGEKGGYVFAAGICVIFGGFFIVSALPHLSSISEATCAATKIFEMIDRIPVIEAADGKGKTLANVKGEIVFREVHFNYPSRPDSPVLQGVNLCIRAGMTIGLVGSSGSGKSTIISLLQRFYDPVRGDIFLDGKKIKRLELKWLRSQMGLVNQEPVLFATSIKENILFGKDGAPEELLVNAAKAANAHDFIIKLPDGYDTQAGQFGLQLSGGQKQRIAIARALIRDPKILLLDEATSALDAQSERTVQEALDKASEGRTTIIIAHRLSTIREADLIAVLQSGRVIESGTHDELIQPKNGQRGAYREMMQKQQLAMQKDDSNSEDYQTEGSDLHILIDGPNQTHPTPISTRSSFYLSSSATPFSPVLIFSPALSVSTTHSVETYPDDHQNDKNSKNSSLHTPSQWRLLRMNVPEWKRALLGCFAAGGSGSIQPIHGYCLGSIVAVYFLTDNSKIKSEIKVYCLIYLSLAVLSFLTSFLQHYNFAIMGERLTKRVRENVLEKVLTFEIAWFDQDENTSAAICSRLAIEANLVRSLIADRMSLLVEVSLSASFSFVLAMVLAWRIAIVMMAIQPLIIASFYSRSVLMKSMSAKAKQAQCKGSQLANEATVNHRTITAFSSQERILHLYRETLRGPKEESIKQSWFSGIGLFSSQFLTTGAVALSYWYGGRLLNQGLVTPKQLFQVFFILMSSGKNIADAGSMTSDISKGGKAITSVFTTLDRITEIRPTDPTGIKLQRITKGLIELRNVFFSYPSRPEQMIFMGLNLKIEAGKTTALVGQSGSGKSTVIGLIERFYDPQSGSVFIDERDIKCYNLRKLRSHMALVSQEPTLFAGSIHENIAYGKENATEAEVRMAAILANAQEFISSMKDGYDTYCGERGVQLSGGQKQRIAIARAILKNPAILLLDEATSALDSMSENLVQEALEQLMAGRTCVVVAHRLSTIQKADSIAVIKNRKVAEQGTHNNLLAIGRSGAYYSLVSQQHGQSP